MDEKCLLMPLSERILKEFVRSLTNVNVVERCCSIVDEGQRLFVIKERILSIRSINDREQDGGVSHAFE